MGRSPTRCGFFFFVRVSLFWGLVWCFFLKQNVLIEETPFGDGGGEINFGGSEEWGGDTHTHTHRETHRGMEGRGKRRRLIDNWTAATVVGRGFLKDIARRWSHKLKLGCPRRSGRRC